MLINFIHFILKLFKVSLKHFYTLKKKDNIYTIFQQTHLPKKIKQKTATLCIKELYQNIVLFNLLGSVLTL